MSPLRDSTRVRAFFPSAAARVVERKWHHTQEFTKLDNGWTKMTIEVGLAPDLYSWIGGFFGECKVIEPVALKETMRKLHSEGVRSTDRR